MRCARQRALSRGFTLIEVMIVVAIIGILLAIALPSYQDTLQKGRRSDGMSALLDASNRQGQFMLDRSTYTSDMTDLGFAANPYISEEGYYSIAAAACGSGTLATCYVLTATAGASSAQARDTGCTSLVLDSTGAKTPNECWK